MSRLHGPGQREAEQEVVLLDSVVLVAKHHSALRRGFQQSSSYSVEPADIMDT